MPNLHHFAVTVDICRFQPTDIRDSLGVDGDDNEPLTDDQVLDWYTAQVQRVADVIPQMLEISLFVRNRIYRGAKSDDGETMKVLPDAVQPGVE